MCISDWINLASAVGTVGATIVALWLALREGQKRVDATFVWESATNYQPTLLVQNTSNRIVVVKSIEIRYNRKRVSIIKAEEESSLSKHAILEAGQIKKIPINIVYLDIPDQKKPKKAYALEVIILLRNGHKHISKQKYSFEEMKGLFFGQSLFSEE